MSLASDCISELNQALKENGEDIILVRNFGINLVPFEVNCRALIREDGNSTPVAGQIIQQNIKVIMSPMEIDEKHWPGFRTGNSLNNEFGDPRLPLKGDIVKAKRGILNVIDGGGIYVDGILVRIEIMARGK